MDDNLRVIVLSETVVPENGIVQGSVIEGFPFLLVVSPKVTLPSFSRFDLLSGRRRIEIDDPVLRRRGWKVLILREILRTNPFLDYIGGFFLLWFRVFEIAILVRDVSFECLGVQRG